MQDVKQLFQHKLRTIYGAEKRIIKIIDETIDQAQGDQVREAFQLHRRQTEDQIGRIEEVFRALDVEPGEMRPAAIEGLAEEKRSIMKEDPPQNMHDMIHVLAGIGVERYEITAYEALLHVADMADVAEAVEPLRRNLQEETQTLEKLQTMVAQLVRGVGKPATERFEPPRRR